MYVPPTPVLEAGPVAASFLGRSVPRVPSPDRKVDMMSQRSASSSLPHVELYGVRTASGRTR